MFVKLTQKHIDAGERGKSKTCPVALAIQETIHHPVIVVGAAFSLKGSLRVWCLPHKVIKFIQDFDDGYVKVQPMHFKLPDKIMIEANELNRSRGAIL